MKQRHIVRMTPEEVDGFVHGRRTMTMATLGRDGRPHLVAMWYGFFDGSPAVETYRRSQKVLNLRRDPRITCLVEAGDRYEELQGVQLVGTARIIEDPDLVWQIGADVFSRYQGPVTDETRPLIDIMVKKRVAVVVDVDDVVSWDHRKLGMGSVPQHG